MEKCPTCKHSKKDLTVCPVCGFIDQECYKKNEVSVFIFCLVLIAGAVGIVIWISQSNNVPLSLVAGLLTFIGIPILIFAAIGLLLEMLGVKNKAKALQKAPDYIRHSDINQRIKGVKSCKNAYLLRDSYFDDKAPEDLREAIYERLKVIRSKDDANESIYQEIHKIAREEQKIKQEREALMEELSKPLHELPFLELVYTLDGLEGKSNYLSEKIKDEYSRIQYICESNNDFRKILVEARKAGFEDFEFSGDRTILSAKGYKGSVAFWVPQDMVFGKGAKMSYMKDDGSKSETWTKPFDTPEDVSTQISP